jgi:endonuclease/exonuclease/phosphatase family metal-dependent hydrolase
MRYLITFLCALTPLARAQETFTVATWNIENFNGHFLAFHLTKAKTKAPFDLNSEDGKELLFQLRAANDKANWETAQVILDDKFNPDVLVIEECCSQEDLEFFNKRWLRNTYETVIVFPTNTDRNQHLGLLAKKGFKVVEKKDQYYQEKDSTQNERGDKLFARGPAFAKIQTPSGYQCWVGVNHQKSKAKNSADATAWRNREAKRTHDIILDLSKTGPDDVIFLGDMNDTLGLDEYEDKAGGDTITNLVGPEQDGLFLATRKLADEKAISYHGRWKEDYRSMIDHVLMTRQMKEQLQDIHILNLPFAQAASDHYPVVAKIKSDPVQK